MFAPDLPSAIHDAILDLLSAHPTARGDPNHYTLQLLNLSPSASRFDLVLTFKSGRTYCCQEPGCHLPFHYTYSWDAIRETIADRALRQPQPMRIKRITTIVEPGARFTTHPDFGLPIATPSRHISTIPGWSERDAKP